MLRGYSRDAVNAVINGDEPALAAMLQAGLDPNSQNKFGTTVRAPGGWEGACVSATSVTRCAVTA